MNINELIEKIDKIAFAKFDSMDPQVKKERELIKAIQERDDKFAMKQLIREYRGVISQEVKRAQLGSVMDQDAAMGHGIAEFKKIIKKNFDLSKENKPITFIKNTLPLELQKRKNEYMDFGVRKSTELTRQAGNVSVATNFLTREYGREPKVNEIVSFIKNDMNKKITSKQVQQIKDYERLEYSGDAVIGNIDGVGDAITLMDTLNINRVSPESMLAKMEEEERIKKEMINFTRPERKLIYHVLGLGEFKNRPAKNLSQAATSNGMTYYDAKKIMNKLKERIK